MNQVVAPDELMPAARKLAERLASKSAVALRQAKAALRASFTMEEDAGLRFEQEAFGLTFASEDRVEGTRRSCRNAIPNGSTNSAQRSKQPDPSRSARFYRRPRSTKIARGLPDG